jgi:hypothetical protein
MKENLKKILGLYIFYRIKFLIRIFLCYNFKDNYFEFLSKRFETDKCIHNYDDYYINMLRGIRYKKLKILEIGIGGHVEEKFLGGSLLLWNSYCPRSKIYGVDLSNKTLFNKYKRIQTFVLDQSDKDDLESFAIKHGPFDIIIDDGSHLTDHILTSFNALYKYVNENGYYVIEDMGTTYVKSLGGEPDIEMNSDFFNRAMLIAKMTTRKFLSNSYNPKKEEFKKLNSITFGKDIIIIKNSTDLNNDYEGMVDPWADKNDLKSQDKWVKSVDYYGNTIEKLDSGQMG